MKWRPTAASILVLVVGCLVAIGVVILYSTSGMPGSVRHADPHFFVKRQLLWIALGAVAFLITSRLDYRVWRSLAVPLAIFSGILLIMVLVPGVGVEVNGSRRWLRAGAISFQPSEVAKLSTVVLLAWWMARVQRNPGHWRHGLATPGAMLGCFSALVLVEPDFGAAMLIGGVGMAVLFAGGARIGYLALVGTGAAGLLGLLIAHNPERSERVLAFLDPWKHAEDAAYQLTQGIYAFVCGGPYGVGLGQSMQKRYFLPEAHTDFIFAILGEELGFRGSLSVALLFFVLFLCGLWIAIRIEDRFGKLMAFGITLLITVQAGLNMGVVTGLLPTKGITLPFISSGGSSMMVSLAMIGILTSIGQAAEAPEDDLERQFTDASAPGG